MQVSKMFHTCYKPLFSLFFFKMNFLQEARQAKSRIVSASLPKVNKYCWLVQLLIIMERLLPLVIRETDFTMLLVIVIKVHATTDQLRMRIG